MCPGLGVLVVLLLVLVLGGFCGGFFFTVGNSRDCCFGLIIIYGVTR